MSMAPLARAGSGGCQRACPTKARGAPRASSPHAPYRPHTGVPRDRCFRSIGSPPLGSATDLYPEILEMEMRKFALASLVVFGAMFAVAGLAQAANTYSSSSKITPSSPGTTAAPKAVAASLTFNVGETSGLRPSPLKTYKIGLGAGIVPNTSVAKGCSAAQANAQVLPALCLKKATSGGAT